MAAPLTALTARQLNRATLGRQLLLARERLDVVEAVRRITAIQAQEPASPYLALWSRVEGFDAGDLDRAFIRGDVVKATLMRITLHAVAAADYPVLHAAMQPTVRASRLGDRRFTGTGLTAADADALIDPLRAHAATPRSNADIEAWLAVRPDGPIDARAWWALRTYGPFVHAPTGGPWSFGWRPSYVAASDRRQVGEPALALEELARRYLEAFGPASARDLARFGMIQPRSRVQAALAALVASGAAVRLEGPGAAELYDVPGGLLPPADVVAPPRLLAMWDSVLLAYADRDRLIPPAYRRLVIRSNGDVLPTLLVDGYVAGAWRPVAGAVEVTAFHALDEETWAGLAAEARALTAFLADRDPAAYGRYARWCGALPAAEVRILGPA